MTQKATSIPKMEGRTHIPILDTEKCVICLICQYDCPDLAVTRDEKQANPIIIDYSICRGCGICAFVCPQEAIEMIVEE